MNKNAPLLRFVDEDTICALSTPAGTGGMAVIRVSGKEALSVCDRLFRPAKGTALSERPSHTLVYGIFGEREKAIDDVVASVFRAPHSFTGENVVELSCHGSLYIQQETLQLLLKNGCRMARAGEFTQRAFLNGKMDISQAEAVADLIASTSEASHRLALSQLKGSFSRELKQLRDEMLTFTSLIELELDFSEEEVEFVDREKLHELASRIEEVVNRLANSLRVGNAIKNGVPVAIVGETNAGKSTLLNLLLKEDKAIVSDIHGTTRDVIEDTIQIEGVTFRFIDTAGIRETSDAIESMGIERTFLKIEQAAIVLWIIDATSSDAHTQALSKVILPKTEGKELVVLFNKSDLLENPVLEHKLTLLKEANIRCLPISARKQTNMDTLEKLLLQLSGSDTLNESDVVVTNARHYEALVNVREAILRIQEGLSNNISGDFLSQDIREAIHYLGEITGAITTDEILGNIFSKFCIGK
jgi:tRNA modification GTPase